MRIAFVLLGDLGLTSGGFIYDRMLIACLRERGHEVDVISLPWRSYAGQIASSMKAVPWPRPVTEYDVVLEDELAHPGLTVCNLRLRTLGVPTVALVHNLTWRQPRVRRRALRRTVEASYLRSVDGAVCVCENTREDVVRALPRDAPSTVAYAGRDHLRAQVDEARVEVRSHEAGPLRVLMLCNVSAHKGVHRMLEVMSAGDALELHIVGAHSDAAYLDTQQRFVRAHDLTRRVHWHGELHGDALWAQLASAHVLALPSDREAYPLSAVEALSAGLPVLATDQGGAGELIRDGVEGRLLAPDDVAAWRQALRELAHDRTLLSRMGAAALRRYHAHGTWAQTAEATESLLLQVSGRRTPRRPWFR